VTDQPVQPGGELALASSFPPATADQWHAAVAKALDGGDAGRLVTTTYDGLAVLPLYTPDEVDVSGDPVGLPGLDPFVRGAHGPDRLLYGWDVRQSHQLAGRPPAEVGREILTDLERGVTSVVIGIDASTTADDLRVALDGVYLDLAPVLLDPGAAVAHGAALLDALLADPGTPAGSLVGLAADPLGALARHGVLDRSLGTLVAELAERVGADGRSGARWLGIDASPYHDAGAADAQELGCALAAGVSHLRALTDAGVDLDDACRSLEFRLVATADQFATMAKLRAARWCWRRVATAAGASPAAAGQRQHVVTSAAMLTRRDPWVNMLRATTACFAAGVAGADAVTVLPFDAAIGIPDELGRRVARNTQLLLLSESQLARVADPGGGSHAVEARTRDVAAAAWAFFQRIEEQGGLEAALRSGWLAGELETTWDARLRNLGRRKDALTGISEFPDVAEAPVSRPPRPAPAPVDAADSVVPLPLRRLAEPFEELRDGADAAAVRPTVFLANLGPVATHTARASFAKNFFEAGGIEAVGDEGFDSPIAAGAAFAASGARLAVICSSDRLYDEHGTATARALKDAGAEVVYLAGRPGERRAEYEAAGVDEFVHVGCDMLATLRAAHARSGR
jgi:methylmalonyl-CoA mutase